MRYRGTVEKTPKSGDCLCVRLAYMPWPPERSVCAAMAIVKRCV